MKKKILFIIWSYTYGGGAEALLTMIVNNLNPQKYDISIIEYHHADIKVEKVNDNIHILPPIERVNTSDGSKKGYQLRYTELLIDKYIRGDYDLYISFNYQIPTFLLPKDTKNIAWIHGDVYDLDEAGKENDKYLQDKAFDKVKKIVAISDNTMQSLEDLFPQHRHKMVKIYNGIDIDKVYSKSMENTDIVLKKPAIVCIGRLDENKNPERMLHVFSLLHQINSKVHLYYLGKGELEKLIKDKVEKMGLINNVHLLGYQDNPFPIVNQADLICLLSRAEGFSMVLLEALALGKPIITTKTGAAETLINNTKCGRIINTDEDAVEAIQYFLNADRDEIKKQCNQSVQRFELKHYIKQIEELIDNVIDS